MRILAQCERYGHEMVLTCLCPETGLKAFIAVHSTVLGPALGGCRMRAYPTEEAALEDVLRLSEGMTYKSSLAGMDLGGGKACIIGDPRMVEGREALFRRFGDFIERLGGSYISAEDMGTSVTDMMHIRASTAHVTGIDPKSGGGGDPSPWTAKGVFGAIRVACERKFGTADLTGRRVAVQGVGHVGGYLTGRLVKAGAAVTVCDTNERAVESMRQQFNVAAVPPDKIYDVSCDVFSPCAIGQTVNETTIQRLGCAVIAGAANNQLSDRSVYEILRKREMLYCPDFAVNSGGVICVGAEKNPGGWKESWVEEKVSLIPETTARVLDRAAATGKFPDVVAIELAQERIDRVRAEKKSREPGSSQL
jgi:leucine dehydrogenase